MEKNNIVIAAFYSFFDVADPYKLQSELLELCSANVLKGTILIAQEGINSTISGTREGISNLKDFLFHKLGLENNIEYKESFFDKYPFKKLKIKVKKEILTFGVDLDVPNQKGLYLNADEWDEMLLRDDVIVVDTRNDYEIEYGTFCNAQDPKTAKFTEVKEWSQKNIDEMKDKHLLMFCTGGIRCEKSTAYMKSLGLDNVYHLKGGILQYFEDTMHRDNMWNGSCYVFDDRVALDKNLMPINKNS